MRNEDIDLYDCDSSAVLEFVLDNFSLNDILNGFSYEDIAEYLYSNGNRSDFILIEKLFEIANSQGIESEEFKHLFAELVWYCIGRIYSY